MLLQLVLLSTVVYIILYYLNVRKYPKGPLPLPLIGNLYHLSIHNLHHELHKLGKKYGHCFTVHIPNPTVVFTDYDTVKEALVTRDMNLRSHLPPETLFSLYPETGIANTDGEVWRVQRRAALRILREFGMGSNIMEAQVNRSIDELMNQLKETNDGRTPYDMNLPVQICVANVINETLFGYHMKYTETDKFIYYNNIFNNHMKNTKDNIFANIISAYPWMQNLPIVGWKGYHEPLKNVQPYHEFMLSEVDAALKSYDADMPPANFVHAYKKQMDQNPNAGLDMKNMYANAMEFWTAGMETTSTSIRWALLYMMKHPEKQEKMRQEIFSVVGTDRRPSLTDKPNLPYVNAFIHEVQRVANIGPFLLSHKNPEDTTVAGHFIPKGALTMPQIWSVMQEDPIFVNPREFRPERFIEADGKTMNKKALERLIAFSIGKRACAGEGLARMELFLIIAALLQQYKFEALGLVDTTPIFSGVLLPTPQMCRVVPV